MKHHCNSNSTQYVLIKYVVRWFHKDYVPFTHQQSHKTSSEHTSCNVSASPQEWDSIFWSRALLYKHNYRTHNWQKQGCVCMCWYSGLLLKWTSQNIHYKWRVTKTRVVKKTVARTLSMLLRLVISDCGYNLEVFPDVISFTMRQTKLLPTWQPCSRADRLCGTSLCHSRMQLGWPLNLMCECVIYSSNHFNTRDCKVIHNR